MNFNTIMTWSYVDDSDELSQSGAVEEIYGYSISEFQQNKNLWYDVIYPEDRRYLDEAIESLDLKYNQEISVQYRIIHKEGYGKNVLGSIKIEERDGRIIYSGYITDMSSHNKSIIGADYRENLLELLKKSLNTLYISDENREKRVLSLLEKLSELMSVDRVILYKNISDSIDKMEFKELHKWGEIDKVKTDTNQSSDGYLKFEKGYERWHKTFIVMKTSINEIVRLMPESERFNLENERVKSILAIPIWVENEFCGFIRFDDIKRERYWSRENINVLSIIGTAIVTSEKYEKSKEIIKLNVEQLKNIRQERDQFLKMLSHQFKTPLSIIELNVRMLEKVEEQLRVDAGKNYRKKIERILRAVKNTKELIETILIKESYKTEDSVPETLDIHKTVEKFVNKTRRDHEGDVDINNKTIIKSLDITLPFSRKTFEYILEAIISNAIKHSDQDIPKVETEVKVEGGFLEFCVKDYGIGIHKEDLDKIGTAFYRGGNVEGIAGIGIGLSMVKEALHSIGGLIEIDSKLGEYTKVLIKIPISKHKQKS